MIDKNPPGLVSRRFFPVPDGKIVMQEEWNLDVPGCPMIHNPWLPRLQCDGPRYIRQVTMTVEEYQDAMR